MPVTIAKKEAIEDDKNLRSNLAQIPYIRYPIKFGTKFVSAPFDSDSEVNAIHLIFAKKLGRFIRPTDV